MAANNPDFDAGEDDGAARRFFARPPAFMRGVASLDGLPEVGPPEVAFAGRSNVGKSSLINALFNRNDVARTSNTPGRTQQLNFFALGEDRLWLVDLPGYGYAKAPKAEAEAWQRLIFDYLRGRPSLRLVCLLIDARHGAKANDVEVMATLAKAAVPFLPVLTKADLVKPAELARRLDDLRQSLAKRAAALPDPLATSAKKGGEIAALQARLYAYALPPGGEAP